MRFAVVGATPKPGIDFLSGVGSCCTVVEDDRLGEKLVKLVSNGGARLEQTGSGLVWAHEVAELGRPEHYLDIYGQLAARS